MGNIYCYGVSGVPLTAAACDLLFTTACQMAASHKDQRKARNDDIQAILETEFEHGVIGSLSGMVFTADVVTEKGASAVKFLVKTDVDPEAYRKAKWSCTKIGEQKSSRKDAYKYN